MLWMLGVSSASARVCKRLLLLNEVDSEHYSHRCNRIDDIAAVMR
jgi:hypothetical protein